MTWEVYRDNSCNTMRNLYTDTAFTDVTLVTEDDKQILAHKVVLASSSCFFRRILMKISHQNPLIYLKGVKFSDLKSIMKFIYLGESEVNKNEIENFMMTGRDLEIDGLLDLTTLETDLNKKKRVHFKLEDEANPIAAESTSDTDMSIESDLENSIEDNKEPQPGGNGEERMGLPISVTRYLCNSCNQSYARQDNLSRHKRLAHGELLL